MGAGCGPRFAPTNALLGLQLLILNPQHCTWKQKHLTQNLQIAGGQGDPRPLWGHQSRPPRCAVPLALCMLFFCWVLVLLHQKKKKYLHVHRQPQNKGSNNPSAPRLTNQHDKPAVLCEPGRPCREAGGSRLRASGPSEGPVGEELLQLPGNGECKDLVRRQEGAQGFAAQVL